MATLISMAKDPQKVVTNLDIRCDGVSVRARLLERFPTAYYVDCGVVSELMTEGQSPWNCNIEEMCRVPASVHDKQPIITQRIRVCDQGVSA
jgi:hypothetical protein